jgi:hypothetical protein
MFLEINLENITSINLFDMFFYIYSNSLNYESLVKFFEECREQLTARTGPVITYKKTILIMFREFSLKLYNGFITSMNFDTGNQIEIEICYDYIEYNYDTFDFSNYITYLRSCKIKRIQSRMKKESIMI